VFQNQSSFAACCALFIYAQQVQIACAIGEAIEALTAGLQKISAELAAASPCGGGLEASKPAPQVVLNNQ
jgi:hypothetical protein